MELSWFESLLYGIISGITEVLPVSSLAHQALFLKIVGSSFDPLLRLFSHIGSLAALMIGIMPMLMRMRRERRIASAPRNRRRRQPDAVTMMEIRLIRVAVIFTLVVFLAYPLVHNLYERLWLLAILMTVNGIVIYVPQFLPGANKHAQTMSNLDGTVIGICAGLGIVPGFSSVAFSSSAAMIRGTDRRYCAELALVLASVPVFVLMIVDFVSLTAIFVSITGIAVINGLIAMVASFVSAWFGIQLLRFTAYRVGFSGFAYYCWGFALLALILYLI